MNYCDLTDEEIYKMAEEQWMKLPIKTRTSAKSIELCEDLFVIREMEILAKSMQNAEL